MAENPQAVKEFKQSGKKKITKPPKFAQPRGIENEYRKWLYEIIAEWRKASHDLIDSQLSTWIQQAGTRADSARNDDWTDYVAQTVGLLKNTILETVSGIKTALSGFAGRTEQWTQRQFQKMLKQAIGVNLYGVETGLASLRNAWIKENVNLITKLAEETHREVEGIVMRGISSGNRAEAIRAKLYGSSLETGRFKKVRNRAALIARDQVSKNAGRLMRTRQRSVGVERYIWRTAEDDRVRESHLVKDGEIFEWDNPPRDTGHPGEDYQCRCYAEPVFKDLFGEDAPPQVIGKGETI